MINGMFHLYSLFCVVCFDDYFMNYLTENGSAWVSVYAFVSPENACLAKGKTYYFQRNISIQESNPSLKTDKKNFMKSQQVHRNLQIHKWERFANCKH